MADTLTFAEVAKQFRDQGVYFNLSYYPHVKNSTFEATIGTVGDSFTATGAFKNPHTALWWLKDCLESEYGSVK